MNSHTVYNYIEVGLWTVYAGVLSVAAWRAQGRQRKVLVMAAVAFLAFAASDAIEVHTGAWWRPWWLLVLKAACIATFAACFIAWWKARSKRRG
jgi:hypothetical protein